MSKKQFFTHQALILSLCCFTLNIGDLFSEPAGSYALNTTDDGVPSAGSPGNCISGCTSTSGTSSCCSSDSSACCTFSNIVTGLADNATSSATIIISPDNGNETTLTLDLSSDFDVGVAGYDWVLKGYTLSGSSATLTSDSGSSKLKLLCNLEFQNNSLMLTNTGLSVSGSTATVNNGVSGWTGNTWTFEYNGTNSGLIFPTGTYPTNYSDAFVLHNNGTPVDASLTADSGVTVYLNGSITEDNGTSSLTYVGPGTFVLGLSTLSSSYTGGTTLSSGTVEVLSGAGTVSVSPFGTGTVTIDDNFSLILTNASGASQTSATIANAFSDTGSSSNTYMGVFSCNGSNCSGTNQYTLTGDMNFAGALYVNTDTATSPGYLILAPTNNNNTIAHLQIDAGRVYLGSSKAVGAGVIHINNSSGADGSLFFSSSFSLDASTSIIFDINGNNKISDSGNMVTIQTGISEAGGVAGVFQKSGGGILTLTASSSYTGGTLIEDGVLSINNTPEINDGVGGITLNGGTLYVSNTKTLSASPGLTIASGGLAVAASDTLTISSSITSSGSAPTLTIGTTQISNASGKVLFSGANTFAGAVTVGLTVATSNPMVFTSYPAALSISSLSNFGSISSLTLQGQGSLLVTGTTTFSSSMTTFIGNNGAIMSAAGGVTASFPGIVSNVSGAVSNTLTLKGGGTVYLSGTANTFSGEFSVIDGTTFQINNAGSLGSSSSTASITLNNSTLSSITNTVSSTRVLNISGTSGTINVGSGLSLTFSGPVTAAGGSTLFVTGGGDVFFFFK